MYALIADGKMIHILFLVLFLFLGSISCGPNDNVNKENDSDVYLLKVNECKSIEDEGISSICFLDVIDNRCYMSACNSCYGSAAKIKFLVRQDTVELSILGCKNNFSKECENDFIYKKDTFGLELCVISLNPYPKEGTSIDLNDYEVKIKIQ